MSGPQTSKQNKQKEQHKNDIGELGNFLQKKGEEARKWLQKEIKEAAQEGQKFLNKCKETLEPLRKVNNEVKKSGKEFASGGVNMVQRIKDNKDVIEGKVPGSHKK